MCEHCRPEFDPEDDGSFGTLIIRTLKEMQDAGEMPLGHQDLTKLNDDPEQQEAFNKLTPGTKSYLE